MSQINDVGHHSNAMKKNPKTENPILFIYSKILFLSNSIYLKKKETILKSRRFDTLHFTYLVSNEMVTLHNFFKESTLLKCYIFSLIIDWQLSFNKGINRSIKE